MKTLFVILTLVLIATACSTPPRNAETGKPPTHTVTEFQGTLPNWTLGAAEVTSTSGDRFFSDGVYEFDGPIYTGTVDSNGTFSIGLTAPTEFDLHNVTCGDQQMNSAVTGELLISEQAPPVHPDEVIATASLVVPGEQPQIVRWVYADRAFQINGECEGGTADVNLDEGWNTVIVTYSGAVPHMETGPVPDNAVWTVDEPEPDEGEPELDEDLKLDEDLEFYGQHD
jgi:hypothetical protein